MHPPARYGGSGAAGGRGAHGRGSRRSAVGTGVAARGALGAWGWPPYCPRHRVSLGATPVPVRSASPRAIGVVLTLEGEGEDLSVIGEAQWFFSRWAFLKMNSGFGLSQKVPDIAPEVGIMMSFRP